MPTWWCSTPAIRDTATYEAPRQAAAGIDTVIVNGAVAWQAGQSTGQYHGQVIRRESTRAAATTA
jgi:N-acyl-D-amino-acid deacylase